MARALDAERRLEAYRAQIAHLRAQLNVADEEWDTCSDLPVPADRKGIMEEMLKSIYYKASEPFSEAKVTALQGCGM